MAEDKKMSEALKIDFDSSICDSPMSVLSSSLKTLSTNSAKKLLRKRLPWDSPSDPNSSPIALGPSNSPSCLVESPMLQQRVLRRNLKFKENAKMSGDKENIQSQRSISGTSLSEDSQDSGYSGSLGSCSQGSFDDAYLTASATETLSEFDYNKSALLSLDDTTMSQHSFDEFLNNRLRNKQPAEKEPLSPFADLHNEKNSAKQIRTSTCVKENFKAPFKRPIHYSPSELVADPEMRKLKIFKASKSLSEIDIRLSTPRSPLKQNILNICPIKEALQKSAEDTSLIGDFSKPHSLPLTKGKHQDLQTITAQTLAELMEGKHGNDNFKIVDCRYPYEFEGGHIKGALNIYTKETILEQFFNEKDQYTIPTVLIFHCEFSSERGPGLYRFVRNRDRSLNAYPKLHYPEIYLLEGGYKVFYQEYSTLCQPQSYLPMLHGDHCKDLRKFRSKSKSWAGEKCSRPTKRVASGLKF